MTSQWWLPLPSNSLATTMWLSNTVFIQWFGPDKAVVLKLWICFRMWATSFEHGISSLPLLCLRGYGASQYHTWPSATLGIAMLRMDLNFCIHGSKQGVTIDIDTCIYNWFYKLIYEPQKRIFTQYMSVFCVWKFLFWHGKIMEKSWNFFLRFLWEPWKKKKNPLQPLWVFSENMCNFAYLFHGHKIIHFWSFC